MMIRQIAGHGLGFQASPGKTDMAVRTQQVERRPRNFHTGQIFLVDGVGGNHVRTQQVAEFRCCVCSLRLPDHDQIEARIVELFVQVLDRAVFA